MRHNRRVAHLAVQRAGQMIAEAVEAERARCLALVNAAYELDRISWQAADDLLNKIRGTQP